MATITVETGYIVSNANSYVSESALSSFAADRAISISGNANSLLIQAMDWRESQPFAGVKYTSGQALQWPRYGVYVDGYYVSESTVPQLLKDAVCEAAIAIDAGSNPLATLGRSTKREKVGEIEVEYMDGSRDAPFLAAAESKLRKLLTSGSRGISAALIRG